MYSTVFLWPDFFHLLHSQVGFEWLRPWSCTLLGKGLNSGDEWMEVLYRAGTDESPSFEVTNNNEGNLTELSWESRQMA